MEIPQDNLLDDGEVPESWLYSFGDFKSWKDLNFKCSGHCTKNFKDLISLINHNFENIKLDQRTISCPFCLKTFVARNSVPSFINHIVKHHKFMHMKFSCMVCSRVFYNMPYLSKHYQEHHSTVRLQLFPCFDCGLYCQGLQNLIKHKDTHLR